MIHASTTASASASTARTVESQTVVQRICHTSGCAITANEARIDSAVIAPGRPGGASRKPASSAVATGVTVSTATVISSNVGSHAPAATRGHESARTRLRPVATAMRASPYRGEPPDHRGEAPEERHGCAGALPSAGGYGGPCRGPST